MQPKSTSVEQSLLSMIHADYSFRIMKVERPSSASALCHSSGFQTSSRAIVSTQQLDKCMLTDVAMRKESMFSQHLDNTVGLSDDKDFDDMLSLFSDESESVGPVKADETDAMLQPFFSNTNETPQFYTYHSDFTIVQDRLRECMKTSSLSQAALQEWDRLNGLPASHSRTMVNTARSRKQLQDGVILRKWNGFPLLSSSDDSRR